MDFSKDIIEILLRAPEGLSIRKIVRHVYNAHNTFFETVDLDVVKHEVTTYLYTRSKTKKSPIVHTSEWGVYKLNLKSEQGRQLALQFTDKLPSDKPAEEKKENSGELSLWPCP